MSPDKEHGNDKLALFVLAGMVVVVLGGVVAGVFLTKTVPDKGDVLLGSVATGLILFLRDLVQTVRASWAEVTQGKITDQLANSGPTFTPKGGAERMIDVGVEEAATRVADAASDAKDEIIEGNQQ